jgi:phosphoglycerol transferase MdoB-like AlkP superfamily enzyme
LMSDDGRLFVKKDVLVSIFAEPDKDFFRMILESPWFWLLVLVLLIATVIIYRRFHEDNTRNMKKK